MALMAELGYVGAGEPATFNRVLQHPEMEIWIAADGHDHPVGLMAISHRPQLVINGPVVTVDELVVTSAWRRLGVGRKLLKLAAERARELGARRLELTTRRARGEAVRLFYERCGFAVADSLVLRLSDLEIQRQGETP